MGKTVKEYVKDIEKALRSANAYNKSLIIQIRSLASALRTLDLADKDIDELEETTVLEETRYGSKLAPHPVFKIQKDAQDSVTRQLKSLGLTAADLAEEIEDDPLINLTEEVKKVAGNKAIIRKKKSKN
jgi:hypothetical protein